MACKIFFYAMRPYDEVLYAERFCREFGIDFGWTEAYPTPQNAALAEGSVAVCTTPCDMGREMVERFYALGVRYICCRSIGYDHVDLARAQQLGMRVANVSYPPNGVANYAIMLMLASLRRFGHIQKRVELQDYSLQGKMGRDISRCTVGVIGTGSIGTTVLRHLWGFGCRLLAYDVRPNAEAARYAAYLPLQQLLAQSDVITLHANATGANHHMIDADAIARMKDGVVIVNTARGKLIDCDALIDGLQSGKVGAAALDVLEQEDGLYYYNLAGQVIQNRQLALLRSFPNVILSPHTAFYTDENVAYMVRGAFESVQAFEAGAPTMHEVPLPQGDAQ